MRFVIVFLALSIVGILNGFPVGQEYLSKYKHYSVYRVLPQVEQHLELLKVLPVKLNAKFDFWTEIRGLNNWVDIMIAPEFQQVFENSLNEAKFKYLINIKDVGALIENQMNLNNAIDEKQENPKLGDFDYSKYHTLDEINDWMNNLEQTYPKFVTIFNVTRSYQKRDIYAMKISIPNASKKPALWFDGGIHAREWISPATVIYMAYSFLSKYNNDSDVTQILNTFDIYILPVFNVDGYEYTWAKDRMWRKTRSKTPIPGCVGADPNRNWNDHFCDDGASKDPCSDTYCGEKPFSESETKGVADFLSKNNDTILCYINFHSYSQLWMSPWGWTTKTPANYTIQDGGSTAAVTALSKLYGTQYTHGNIASTIYIASGSSVDWAYDIANIFYSYAVELRDQGQYGFLLPPDQIVPSGLETFEAIKALAFFIEKNLKKN